MGSRAIAAFGAAAMAINAMKTADTTGIRFERIGSLLSLTPDRIGNPAARDSWVFGRHNDAMRRAN
jgi:hypothetical protein